MRYNAEDPTTRLYVWKVLQYYKSLRGTHFAHIRAFYAAQLEG